MKLYRKITGRCLDCGSRKISVGSNDGSVCYYCEL